MPPETPDASDPDHLPVGFTFGGDYIVDGEALGRGGFGVVYPCRHRPSGERRAVKLITSGETAANERARKEAEQQRQLYADSVGGILPVYDVRQEVFGRRAHTWFAMKLVPGARTLDDADLTYAERVRLLIQALDTVHELHARGFLHRDLKPSNVLVDEAGAAMVTDFGLASRARDATHTARFATTLHGRTSILGAYTPWFAPPEQQEWRYNEELLDRPQVDVYPCGLMVHDLLSDVPADREQAGWVVGQKRKGGLVEAPKVAFAPPEEALKPDEVDRAIQVMSVALAGAIDVDWDRRASSLAELLRALRFFERALAPEAKIASLGTSRSIVALHSAFLPSPGERAVDKPVRPLAALAPPGLWSWQMQALAAWQAAGRRGIVEACTGAGKTRVAIEAIQRHLVEGAGARAIVLVPTLPLVDQWIQRLNAALVGRRVGARAGGQRAALDDVDVLVTTPGSLPAITRASRKLGPDTLLIADECHHYGGQAVRWLEDGSFEMVAGVWASLVLELPCAARLGLSATIDPPLAVPDTVLMRSLGSVVFSYGLADALRDQVIAPFRVAFVRCPFDSPEREQQYRNLTFQMGRLRQTLVGTHNAPSGSFAAFMQAVARLAEQQVGEAKRFLVFFDERRKLLAEVTTKYEALRSLAPLLKRGVRGLVFAQRVSAAHRALEVLEEAGLPVGYIDQGVKARSTIFRALNLDTHQVGGLRVIVSPQVLDEGVDVPRADFGIVLMASASKRQMVQRIGRVVRKREHKVAKFVVLVVAGTNEDPTTGQGHEDFVDEVLAAVGPDGWRVFKASEVLACGDWLESGAGAPELRPASPAPLRLPRPAEDPLGVGAAVNAHRPGKLIEGQRAGWDALVRSLEAIEAELGPGHLSFSTRFPGQINGLGVVAVKAGTNEVALLHVWKHADPLVWLYAVPPEPDQMGRGASRYVPYAFFDERFVATVISRARACSPVRLAGEQVSLFHRPVDPEDTATEEADAWEDGDDEDEVEVDDEGDGYVPRPPESPTFEAVLVEFLAKVPKDDLLEMAGWMEVDVDGRWTSPRLARALVDEHGGYACVHSLFEENLRSLLRAVSPDALVSGGNEDRANRLYALLRDRAEPRWVAMSRSELSSVIQGFGKEGLLDVAQRLGDGDVRRSWLKARIADELARYRVEHLFGACKADQLRAIADAVGLPSGLALDALRELLVGRVTVHK